jgi:hypothetical protein
MAAPGIRWIQLGVVITFALIGEHTLISRAQVDQSNPNSTTASLTARSAVNGSQPSFLLLSIALESYEIEVGQFPVVQVEVAAPHEKDLRIINFAKAEYPYGRFGASLFDSNEKEIQSGFPKILSPAKLDDRDALVVNASSEIKGSFRTRVAPQEPGKFFLQVEYSPTFSPAQYIRAKFLINVIPKKESGPGNANAQSNRKTDK